MSSLATRMFGVPSPSERGRLIDGVHITAMVTTVYVVERVHDGKLVEASVELDREAARVRQLIFEGKVEAPYLSPEVTPGG